MFNNFKSEAVDVFNLMVCSKDLYFQKFKDLKLVHKSVAKYVSLSRNALAVIFGICLSYFLSRDGKEPFQLTGIITSGLPPFKLPSFYTTDMDGKYITFSNMVRSLGSSIMTIPLISILEVVAIAKAFCKYITTIYNKISIDLVMISPFN